MADNGNARLDRMEKIVEFILEEQAKTEARFGRVGELIEVGMKVLASHGQILVRHEKAMAAHEKAMEGIDEKLTQLASSQLLTEEKMRELAVAQLETSEKLNALVQIVDDVIRNRPRPGA